jgi:hypothetical protein
MAEIAEGKVRIHLIRGHAFTGGVRVTQNHEGPRLGAGSGRINEADAERENAGRSR